RAHVDACQSGNASKVIPKAVGRHWTPANCKREEKLCETASAGISGLGFIQRSRDHHREEAGDNESWKRTKRQTYRIKQFGSAPAAATLHYSHTQDRRWKEGEEERYGDPK
ncbi:unnamed protein product, partial [Pleuronectes platessa]